MPHDGQVKRQAAGDDEDGVDADVVAWPGEARCKRLRGGGDAAQAIAVERHRRGTGGRALLDLDEGEHRAAPSDEVNLPAAHFDTPGEDPPAVETKPPGGDGLRAATALLGFPAVQSEPPSARARA